MAVKRNAVELETQYPQAAEAVFQSFYVDDGLVGAETIEEAQISWVSCKNCSKGRIRIAKMESKR